MNKKNLARTIEKHYLSHGVHVRLKYQSADGNGERVIFRIKLKPGTKASLVFDRAADIKTALELSLFQPFRDGLAIYLAVSKSTVLQSSLIKILKSQMFCRSRFGLPIALGYNMRGEFVFADLAKMPHALYAGSTNSGKSVGLICLIISLIVRQPVQRVNFILFDVGANSLELFNDMPHLSYPIVKDADTGIYVITKLVEELERRIKLDIEELRNQPAIVCVVDEYVSFINNIDGKIKSQELADQISNLLRRGRHGKIHIVLATQDPTLKNMKVDINNITARLAFKCAKYHNSIAILGEGGAEKLPGNGAMLYKSNEYPDSVYLQGAYISPEEAVRIVDRIKSADHDLSNKFLVPEFDGSKQLIQDVKDLDGMHNRTKELAKIIMWTLEKDTISASQIMDHFTMGNRAYDIVDELYELGIVAEKFYNQPRRVLSQAVEDLSENVLELLKSNGISVEAVSEAILNRLGN